MLQRPREVAFWARDTFIHQAEARRGIHERPYDLKVKYVCEPCNTSWMSRLQTAARLLVTEFANGGWPDLSLDDRQLLARWCAMVAISLEHHGRVVVSHQSQRTELMNGGMPGGWRAYVGTLPTARHAGRSHASAVTAPLGTFPGEHLRAGTTYFVVERAVFHAYYTLGEFTFSYLPYETGWTEDQSPLAKIWRAEADIGPQRFVTADQVAAMQAAIKWRG